MPFAKDPWVPRCLLGLSLLFFAAGCVIAAASGTAEASAIIFLGALATVFGVTGTIVAEHRADNPIGWIFLGASLAASSTYLAEAWANAYVATGSGSAPVAAAAATYDQVSWIPFVVAPTTFLLLLVPEGHLLAPRWRWIGWIAGIGMVGSFVSAGVVSGPIPGYTELDNPFGVASGSTLVPFQAVALALVALGIVGSVASLVVRFRRARGEERLQLKWLALAGAVAGFTILVATTAGYALVGDEPSNFVIIFSLMGLPVATGVAILRYRLYDIDLVINRTLVYGLLTTSLAAVYLGTVLLLQLALSTFTAGSSLAVAASTLAVAGLFRPARARIQRAVDRQFFRSKYDAQQTLAHFGSRIRDEVDLAEVGAGLLAVVDQTMRPSHVRLWLRAKE